MSAGLAEGFRLTYDRAGESVTTEFNQPRVLIGRSPECDLVLPLSGISRRHAAIERSANGWVIRDLDSRNGTFVNRERVAERPLCDGDRINFGPMVMVPLTITFHLQSAPSPGEEQVSFHDEPGLANVSLSIDVADFERSMGGPKHADLGTSLVGLFKQIGEVLLTSENLEEMLGKVLDLALGCLPAERGFICLCDETAESIVAKSMRTRGLARGELLSISHSIAREAIRARQALLVSDAPSDVRFAQASSIRSMDIRGALCAPLYHAGQAQGLIYVDTHRPDRPFQSHDLELIAALGVLTAVGMAQVRLRDDIRREREIRQRLARYSSPRVVEQILSRANCLDGEMLAEDRELSVLFADLSGFTTLAEGMKPAEVAQVLNCAFEQLTAAVFQYEGTLDKYMGDALMAIFGAPLPQPDHAERAIAAALLMQQFLDQHNRTRGQGEPLRMRVGINSGTAVAGDIGSPIRKDYTVIGDVVNVASRLESSVALPGQVVIGPATYELVKDKFSCEPLPEIQLKGKRQAVRPYLIVPQTVVGEGIDSERLGKEPSLDRESH